VDVLEQLSGAERLSDPGGEPGERLVDPETRLAEPEQTKRQRRQSRGEDGTEVGRRGKGAGACGGIR
jgi:hypothetical protein